MYALDAQSRRLEQRLELAHGPAMSDVVAQPAESRLVTSLGQHLLEHGIQLAHVADGVRGQH